MPSARVDFGERRESGGLSYPMNVDRGGRMYRQLLAEVRTEQARYGGHRQPPCTEERLALLRRRVREELGAELPDEYAAFLREQDGLNYNGLFIYASETRPIVGVRDAA